MNTSAAPMEIGHVALVVNDLHGVGAFYHDTLGLEPLGGDGTVARWGAGDRVLLELRSDPAARRWSRREAGLFHTAFLLPDRAALGRWLHHASDRGLRLDGASDHGVSEAFYLTDPEGNGIEVYVDRPRDAWPRKGGALAMVSDPIDLAGVAAAADGPWTGAPAGTVVGHVHLQVGTQPEAEAFYDATLGFALQQRYPGASFFGAGGYHHHLAGNVWNSRGAGVRPEGTTGLAEVAIRATPDALAGLAARTGGATTLSDPWGNVMAVTPRAA